MAYCQILACGELAKGWPRPPDAPGLPLTDGRNRLLRGAANLDIEGRAGIFAFEHGEEGLLGIVAEAAVVEADADADDYDIGLDVGTGALADVKIPGPNIILDGGRSGGKTPRLSALFQSTSRTLGLARRVARAR